MLNRPFTLHRINAMDHQQLYPKNEHKGCDINMTFEQFGYYGKIISLTTTIV